MSSQVHTQLSTRRDGFFFAWNLKYLFYLHKNSQTVKKGVAHAKKQSCEIKSGNPEVAVVVW